MVSSQMRESLALDNGCTLAAYPCRSAAVRGIRARVVSFNNIHRSDHAFVVAAMYSVSVGIGGLVGSRPIWSYSFLSMLTRAWRSRTIGINVRLRRLTIRPQLDKVQIEAIELVFGEDNALDDATPDSRDKVFATTMVYQFDKTFPEWLTARTEVQIFETDGFQLYLSPVIPVCFGVFVTARRPSVRFTRRLFVQLNPSRDVGSIVGQVVASVCCLNIIN